MKFLRLPESVLGASEVIGWVRFGGDARLTGSRDQHRALSHRTRTLLRRNMERMLRAI